MTDNHAMVEAVETDTPEVENHSTVSLIDQSSDHVDAVIAFAAKAAEYQKAMDTIRNMIIKQSYANDWISHSREGVAESDMTANIGAAAAERIASLVGIQERNWTKGEKIWTEDRTGYTWIFEADFGYRGRWVHAIGQAGTKDKFFGYANGQWKDVSDVREDDIKKAAFRACRKEGVRTLLGLRNIPVTKLGELGFDKGRIKFAAFQSKVSASEKAQAAVSGGSLEREIMVKSAKCEAKKNKEGKDYFIWQVLDEKDTRYSFFGPPTSKRGSILTDAAETRIPVKIKIEIKTVNGKDYYGIHEVNGLADA